MVIVQRKEYNILLLGQTGTGKSMFINGLYNYMSFENLDQGLQNGEARYCVPTPFQWFDDDKCYTINLQDDHNEDHGENQKIGQSATQHVRSHLFEFGDIAIRIIDTPGFGDTAGMDKDEQICESLMKFLSFRSELINLHGIIFVFKPNDTRLTTFFLYCLNHIFSKLHKDACENISFVFTHSKGENYKPGPTLTLLRKVIGSLPNVNIQLSKTNIFCVENDCIKFLLTYFCNNDNLKLDHETEFYRLSWKRSLDACIRLMSYIKGLAPHPVKDTVAINVARNYSVKLDKHLLKILDNIKIEIENCITIEQEIRDSKDDVELLKEVLYRHTETRKEEGRHLVRKKGCHCESSVNGVFRNNGVGLADVIVGAHAADRTFTVPTLLIISSCYTHGQNKIACCSNCKAFIMSFCEVTSMWKNECKICRCNMLDHVYETGKDFVDVQLNKNEEVESKMGDKQKFINYMKLKAFEMKINIKKYKAERIFINYWIGKLRRYLKQTAISSDQTTNEDENSDGDIGDEKITFPGDMDKMLKKLSALEMTGKDIEKLFHEDNIQRSEEKVYHIDPVPKEWMDVLERTI